MRLCFERYFCHHSIIFSHHCVKSGKIRSFFWSVFSCIRWLLPTNCLSVLDHFVSKSPYSVKYRKIQTRKNSVFGHFSRSVQKRHFRNKNFKTLFKSWNLILDLVDYAKTICIWRIGNVHSFSSSVFLYKFEIFLKIFQKFSPLLRNQKECRASLVYVKFLLFPSLFSILWLE